MTEPADALARVPLSLPMRGSAARKQLVPQLRSCWFRTEDGAGSASRKPLVQTRNHLCRTPSFRASFRVSFRVSFRTRAVLGSEPAASQLRNQRFPNRGTSAPGAEPSLRH